jgi:hypothetical protein
MWIWCHVSENSSTDIGDKQRPPVRSNTDEDVSLIGLIIRQDAALS